MSTIQIQVFAVLKDYFKSDFELTISDLSIKSLLVELERENPTSSKILHSCRFAVNENFVSNDYKLTENDKVAIIPPSSGG